MLNIHDPKVLFAFRVNQITRDLMSILDENSDYLIMLKSGSHSDLLLYLQKIKGDINVLEKISENILKELEE